MLKKCVAYTAVRNGFPARRRGAAGSFNAVLCHSGRGLCDPCGPVGPLESGPAGAAIPTGKTEKRDQPEPP